jgi:hypothetical protein
MSIALMVRIEALERRLAALEAAVVAARGAPETDQPTPTKRPLPAKPAKKKAR